ncbi:hypothetical protein OG930_25040 [Streptomyces sp. NBC_01799]|nr:hypothetical protein OG930_25040 [Streptomyces sp. NBC_01799]
MTAAAVRSVADPRPVRASVGRRALQVVLFLGGLLALGLIFGAEAHAAQAPVPSLPPAGTAVAHGGGAQDRGTDAAAEPVDVPNAEAARGLPNASAPVPTQVPAAGPSGAPTAETHARPMAASASTAPASAASASSTSASTFSVSATSATPATPATPATSATSATTSVSTDTATSVAVAGARSVVRTTRDTVRYLVRPVGEAVEGVGTAVDSAAGVLPDVWALPARLLLPVTAADPPAEGRPGHGSTGGGAAHAAAPAPRPVCGYTSEADRGRNPVALLNGTSASGTDSRGPAPRYGPAPERAPLDPRGGSGQPSSTEAHGPRGGEQHAVPFAGGTSFGLIRGAGLPATVAPIRDRSGDILEFPG